MSRFRDALHPTPTPDVDTPAANPTPTPDVEAVNSVPDKSLSAPSPEPTSTTGAEPSSSQATPEVNISPQNPSASLSGDELTGSSEASALVGGNSPLHPWLLNQNLPDGQSPDIAATARVEDALVANPRIGGDGNLPGTTTSDVPNGQPSPIQSPKPVMATAGAPSRAMDEGGSSVPPKRPDSPLPSGSGRTDGDDLPHSKPADHGSNGDSGNGGLPPDPPSSSDPPSNDGEFNDLVRMIKEKRGSNSRTDPNQGSYVGRGLNKFYRPSVIELADAVQAAQAARQRLTQSRDGKTIAVSPDGEPVINGFSGSRRNNTLAIASEVLARQLRNFSDKPAGRDRSVDGNKIDGSIRAGHAERKVLMEELAANPSAKILALGVDRLMCANVPGLPNPYHLNILDGGCFQFFAETAVELRKTIVVAEMDQANNLDGVGRNQPTVRNTLIFHPDGQVDVLPV